MERRDFRKERESVFRFFLSAVAIIIDKVQSTKEFFETISMINETNLFFALFVAAVLFSLAIRLGISLFQSA